MSVTAEKKLSDELSVYVRTLVESAPPLTEERRSRIISLFRAGAPA